MQIIRDVDQGSAEWLNLRLGIVTCSELECLLVNGKGQAGFGAGAFTYMDTLIGERITGEAADPFGGNRHTERGHELEGVARGLYEAREEVATEQVAIILNHGIGYSPDSLVGPDGLTEIKTKLPASGRRDPLRRDTERSRRTVSGRAMGIRSGMDRLRFLLARDAPLRQARLPR